MRALTWRERQARDIPSLASGWPFHVARWIAARTMGPAGFHHLGSAFADQRIAETREKLARGDTLYLAGIGLPGMHNSGVALVEVHASAWPTPDSQQ